MEMRSFSRFKFPYWCHATSSGCISLVVVTCMGKTGNQRTPVEPFSCALSFSIRYSSFKFGSRMKSQIEMTLFQSGKNENGSHNQELCSGKPMEVLLKLFCTFVVFDEFIFWREICFILKYKLFEIWGPIFLLTWSTAAFFAFISVRFWGAAFASLNGTSPVTGSNMLCLGLHLLDIFFFLVREQKNLVF